MNSVTVPCIVSGLFSSYSAFPWWANMGTEKIRKPIATGKNERGLLIAATPCRRDLGEDSTIHPAMPSNNARKDARRCRGRTCGLQRLHDQGKPKSFAADFSRQCLGIEVAIRANRNILVLTPGRIEVF